MSKVRVYEVARQLGIKNKELVLRLQSMGLDVRNHMSAVEADVVERVKRQLERRSEPAKEEERIRPTVVKRRSRAATRRRVPAAGAAPAAQEAAAASPQQPRASAPRAAAADPAAQSGEAAPAPPVEPTPAEPAAEPSQATAEAEAPQPSGEPKSAESTAGEPAAPVDRSASPAGEPPPQPVAAQPEAPAAPAAVVDAAAAGAASPPPLSAQPKVAEPAPRRPTSPPKRGIEVWGGRPGVPMPQRPRAGGPAARRTTYDPRANAAGARGRYGYRRPVAGRPMRPGFGRGPGRYARGQRRGPVEVSTKEMSARKMVIKIEGETSLQALAAKMSLKATDVLMKLLSMGMTAVNINSSLEADTAKLLASEFGWTVEDVSIDVEEELEAALYDDEEVAGAGEPRAPIVTVMGHVDHGKTTLLDHIRASSVAAGEAGGITQHIGAYRVDTKKGAICFLDTPGHEAFTAMRARGASVTDLVILIVAADDGVMPQTREAIAHAKDAKVPIIVAVNKIDKPGVDPERIMRDLAAEGLQPEQWGGDTIFRLISAKTGEGVDGLLEMVVLQAEMLELVAHPERRASGVVIEALLDRGRGPVARVLMQDGTLHRGDVVLAGCAHGKIRAMVDEKGRKVREAGPATPVEVLGFNEVPAAGDPVNAVKNTKNAETLAAERQKKVTRFSATPDARFTLDMLATALSEQEQLELKIILKADVRGSVEALAQALAKLSTDKVKLVVVHTGVGGITETDVNLAVAARAIIIGFNVRPAGKARKCAEQEGIEIRLYSVIYEAIDEVRAAMEGLLPATKVEKDLGKAEVRQVFRITKVGTIAGCMVIDGIVRRSSQVRLVRDSKVVWTGKLSSLKRFKDDAREVREGLECGIGLEGYGDVKEGDIIEAFEIEEIKATLD